MSPTWFTVLTWMALAVAFASAGLILFDIYGRDYRLKMPVMEAVWPVTALLRHRLAREHLAHPPRHQRSHVTRAGISSAAAPSSAVTERGLAGLPGRRPSTDGPCSARPGGHRPAAGDRARIRPAARLLARPADQLHRLSATARRVPRAWAARRCPLGHRHLAAARRIGAAIHLALAKRHRRLLPSRLHPNTTTLEP